MIAFPKTATAVDLMSDAPSPVDQDQLKELAPADKAMRKIALPEQGIETLYGAHDANLKHIESLLNVDIRTQGIRAHRRGRAGRRAARRSSIFDQLRTLMDGGLHASATAT